MTAEHQRLKANSTKRVPLEQWGPYLSERQWGTVREDYSEWGDAWNYFPFQHAHSRAYRWGEDGLGGISDFFGNLCFSVALWNGKDHILKERLFGLGNNEGNHGEDVKELYYYLANLPTHYYMQFLYKYPQKRFPYEDLVEQNRNRSKLEPEYEILDTGVFDDNRYFDVYITYAKVNKKDIGIKIEVVNRATTTAPIIVLPTLWFFNRWQSRNMDQKPSIRYIDQPNVVKAHHERLGDYYLHYQQPDESLFTENETNTEKLFGIPNASVFVKDAFHDAIIEQKNRDALRNRKHGTKFAPVYALTIEGGASQTIYLRLSDVVIENPFTKGFTDVFDQRKKEEEEFYDAVLPAHITGDLKNIQKQALAGLLWSKQYYYYDIERWIGESDGVTATTERRLKGRNNDWQHLKNQDIILMPDKWEYPWYAAWDLAFHCVPMALVDPNFAKHQITLIMREWYMKPDGQLPAYEWNFSDVNPPVQAWSAFQVYKIEKRKTGKGDIQFLKKVFHKLIINFTWWINRKDPQGRNIFQGGFLGLDNIGVFNRSIQLHSHAKLEQADGTSWMGMYALSLMDIAIEIAMEDDAFEDSATKFFEHFVLIAEALNQLGMWNEEDQFFYDTLGLPDNTTIQLRIQSIVGLTSLFAVSVIGKKVFHKLEDFARRTGWFEHYRLKNNKFWPNEDKAEEETILLSLIPKDRLIALLKRLLNETEFLSEGGIRALSKYHEKNPYSVTIEGEHYSIQYDPGDSTSDFFGGNSNWRGPVWMPVNYLIIQSIKKFGKFYGATLSIEYPTGSGVYMELSEIAAELSKRVVSLFELDTNNHRKLHGDENWFYSRPENRNLVLFYEYFHGDNGSGLGASHQTGWTSLIAQLISDEEE
ncbi:MAG: glucosidase [Bacteroidota bacterium]|nr:glucosidase [Bacteroidota bacterium]